MMQMTVVIKDEFFDYSSRSEELEAMIKAAADVKIRHILPSGQSAMVSCTPAQLKVLEAKLSTRCDFFPTTKGEALTRRR
jgi:hypothetical protein